MKSNYLSVVQFFGIASGIWMLIDKKTGKFPRLLYRIYSKTLYLLNVTSTMLFIISYPELFEDSTKLIDGSLFTIMWIMCTLKVSFVRSQKTVFIFENIIQKETSFNNAEKTEEKDIFETYTNYNLRVSKYYAWFAAFAGSEYVVAQTLKIFSYTEEESGKKIVLSKRPLMLLFRLPFDMDEHYLITFVIQTVSTAGFALYFITYAVILFSQLFFVLSQLKLLQNRLSNIRNSTMFDGKSKEEAIYLQLKNCILEHKTIIRFDINFYKPRRCYYQFNCHFQIS